jgi:UDP-galactopyranose mutase
MEVDYLIVGAGLSGLVFAERAAGIGRTSLIVDKRDHIGGNCYDEIDQHGLLIHRYGPHYFRTNSPKIVEYLSQFTAWHQVNYKIKVYTNGKYWNFPINLNTFEQLIGADADSETFESWLASNRIPIKKPSNSEEAVISQVGWELYRLFYEGYTKKQWNCHPRELDASVCGRIPVRTNRDDRYLQETFQALPKAGYTAMFQQMVESCGDRIRIILNEDFRAIRKVIDYKKMVYTGPIDAFYDHYFGPLPYRSLEFSREHYNRHQLIKRRAISGIDGFYQPAMQVNYPCENDFTRIVELKHATGQRNPGSTIVKEYPVEFDADHEPYYPVPNPQSTELYKKYRALADREKDVLFIGRLARYKYYNMDQIVGMALATFNGELSGG